MCRSLLCKAVSGTLLEAGRPITVEQAKVEILRTTPSQSGPIDVIDGDTVRFQGASYRLVGFGYARAWRQGAPR